MEIERHNYRSHKKHSMPTHEELYADGNVLGYYNPFHFLVRLDPRIRDILDRIGTGVFKSKDIGHDAILGFSTLFHETIHWWQHIGSTNGLMLSFAYPAQFLANLPHLTKVLNQSGPRKSIRSYLMKNKNLPIDEEKTLNIILNNWHDIEFNRRLIMDPLAITNVVESPFFESVGHSLFMGLSHTLGMIASSFDRKHCFLPNPENWVAGFEDLSTRKVPNYYYGSEVRVFGIGARRIFEGQARFLQLQYLALSSEGNLNWKEFENLGMLGDTYTYAFEKFLELSELPRPDTILHPTINLFLLICDISINPSDGYPYPLTHFESFTISVDPGARFWLCCRYLAKNHGLKDSIQKCSIDEYKEVSSLFCKAMVCRTPCEIANLICRWSENEPSLQDLLNEDNRFVFLNENLPTRVCFARHLRFMMDKSRHPEFFCWPSTYFVDNSSRAIDLGRTLNLWNEHLPLFLADLDGEIRPTIRPNRNSSNTLQTLNDFLISDILFDFVRQWTVTDGPFNYDYKWMSPKFDEVATKPHIDRIFLSTFGEKPDAFDRSGPP